MKLCRLNLRSSTQVEDLQCPSLSLKGNNVLMPVHDGTIGLDWSSYNLILVLEVDDEDLWGSIWIVARFLSYTNVVVGFKSLVWISIYDSRVG